VQSADALAIADASNNFSGVSRKEAEKTGKQKMEKGKEKEKE
jgi:hypothetical protein